MKQKDQIGTQQTVIAWERQGLEGQWMGLRQKVDIKMSQNGYCKFKVTIWHPREVIKEEVRFMSIELTAKTRGGNINLGVNSKKMDVK